MHYERLRKLPDGHDTFVQCPFGLSSLPVKFGPRRLALTGFVPFPRMGGGHEKVVAKTHPSLKVDANVARRAGNALVASGLALEELERQIVQQQSMALHEIRKLNRTIKQTAERLCISANRDEPDRAPSDFVNIWKAAELMSKQFDVLEILANESLARLPLNTVSEPYRVFDKCARIYREHAKGRVIKLWSPPNYYPRVAACDKTFPILASVLIENAVKYSIPGGEIQIDVTRGGTNEDRCVIEVVNFAPPGELTSRVFQKGVRHSTDSDGSGNGLYVAELVAIQHGSKLTLLTTPVSGFPARQRVVFKMEFPEKVP